jgi:hypothetical protein
MRAYVRLIWRLQSCEQFPTAITLSDLRPPERLVVGLCSLSNIIRVPFHGHIINKEYHYGLAR